MRRIDAIALGLAALIMGAVIYGVLQLFGLDAQTAGVWSQVILVAGLLGWLLTYFFRVFTKQMTYNQQLQDYEDAVLEKRLQALTPEELAQLQVEIEADSSDA